MRTFKLLGLLLLSKYVPIIKPTIEHIVSGTVPNSAVVHQEARWRNKAPTALPHSANRKLLRNQPVHSCL